MIGPREYHLSIEQGQLQVPQFLPLLPPFVKLVLQYFQLLLNQSLSWIMLEGQLMRHLTSVVGARDMMFRKAISVQVVWWSSLIQFVPVLVVLGLQFLMCI